MGNNSDALRILSEMYDMATEAYRLSKAYNDNADKLDIVFELDTTERLQLRNHTKVYKEIAGLMAKLRKDDSDNG